MFVVKTSMLDSSEGFFHVSYWHCRAKEEPDTIKQICWLKVYQTPVSMFNKSWKFLSKKSLWLIFFIFFLTEVHHASRFPWDKVHKQEATFLERQIRKYRLSLDAHSNLFVYKIPADNKFLLLSLEIISNFIEEI